MLSVLKKLIDDKNILILGYGREGESTLKKILLLGNYRTLTVADRNDVSERLPGGVDLIFGEGYQDRLDEFDVIFKSPGVVLCEKGNEFFRMSEQGAKEGVPVITSETEVFMQAYGDRVIGITGTKGKSTTSSLMYHVLGESGKDAVFGGNIGIPVFELVDKIGPETLIVLELSCHQLEYLRTDPHAAVLLNIYEDHLDHYGTRERYAAAKKRIFEFQKPGDLLFTTEETFEKETLNETLVSEYVPVAVSDAPFESFEEVPGAKLMGEHNRLNAAFVYKVLSGYGIDRETFIRALGTFEPLPHRLERFLSEKGRDYYDDSISTTVQSAISAVESVDNASIILLGGMERNLEYGELIRYLRSSRLDMAVCMYESGRRIYDELVKDPGKIEAVYCEDLEKAVSFSVDHLKPGGALILSPAAASYGHFKNFEDRGLKFKELVNSKLKK